MTHGNPDLSVIIPSVNGWGDLEGALRALQAQTGDLRVEIIVVDRIGDALRSALRQSFPHVTLIAVDAGTTIPRMRELGFGAAHAEVVGVIEDHVIVPPDWAQRMLDAHARGEKVVGGAVENAATGRLVDWAAFLCEYSHCLVPPPAGPAPWVTGNNVTYRRALLQDFASTIRRGCWENVLHDAIRDSGVALTSRPDIVVGHKKHYTIAEYTHQRYLYSRAYAAMRVAGSSLPRRVAFGLAALALPPIVLWRVTKSVLASGRHRAHLARSMPLLVLFAAAWGLGEAVGYLRGDGGALARVT